MNESIFYQATTSWGGNILLGDDGKYHLWVSRMAHGEGLQHWGKVSEIDHAIASDPMDVFDQVETVLPKEVNE